MSTKNKLIKQIQKPEIIILTILTISGLSLRLYTLGGQSVWLDEAITSLAAKGFLKNGFPILPSGHEYTRAILHSGLVSLSYASFGYTTFAGRIPAVIFGTLSIIVSYFLGKKLKNKRVGLILAFFLTFATVQIAWSRQVRMYQQLQFFFLLSLYFFERLLNRMNWKNLAITLFSVFCMTISHDPFGYLLTIPLIVWFLIDKANWLKQRILKIRKTRLKDVIITITLVGIIAIIIYLKGFELTGFVSRVLETNVNYSLQYFSHFRNEMGLYFILAAPGAVLGFYEGKKHSIYLLSFFLPFYFVAFHVLALQHRYVFMLFPLLFLFATLTLEHVYKIVKKFSLKKWRKNHNTESILPTVTISIIIIALLPTGNFTLTPKTHYDLGSTAPQAKFRPAYQYIENNWRENDVIISTLTPITWYYLQKSDYWISFSYWGLDTKPKNDSYTGARTIQSREDLQEIIKENQGWLVLESMGKRDIDPPILNLIGENLTPVTKVSGERVWIYQFN